MIISGCHLCSCKHIGCGCCPFLFSLSPVSLSCASEEESNLSLEFSYNSCVHSCAFYFALLNFFSDFCSVWIFLSCISSLAKTVTVVDIFCLEYLYILGRWPKPWHVVDVTDPFFCIDTWPNPWFCVWLCDGRECVKNRGNHHLVWSSFCSAVGAPSFNNKILSCKS